MSALLSLLAAADRPPCPFRHLLPRALPANQPTHQPTTHPLAPPCRRELNRLDNAKGAKATDALLNYETVKYFGNEALERRNFADVRGA